MDDPTDLVGQDAASEKEADKRQLERKQEENDLQSVMATAHGRRFVGRLLNQCGVYRTSYVGNAEDTFFREGQRSIGLNLLNDVLSACPERYFEHLQERVENARPSSDE